MKKIIFASALTISTLLAFDVSSSLGTVGNALGITAQSIGKQLTNIVKAKAPATAEQAKSYCTQASTYKSFVGIAEEGMMSKAIDICAQKSSEGLESKSATSDSSLMNTATKLLGK